MRTRAPSQQHRARTRVAGSDPTHAPAREEDLPLLDHEQHGIDEEERVDAELEEVQPAVAAVAHNELEAAEGGVLPQGGARAVDGGGAVLCAEAHGQQPAEVLEVVRTCQVKPSQVKSSQVKSAPAWGPRHTPRPRHAPSGPM